MKILWLTIASKRPLKNFQKNFQLRMLIPNIYQIELECFTRKGNLFVKFGQQRESIYQTICATNLATNHTNKDTARLAKEILEGDSDTVKSTISLQKTTYLQQTLKLGRSGHYAVKKTFENSINLPFWKNICQTSTVILISQVYVLIIYQRCKWL